ncbi:MAG TPA: hypothetical protein VK670_16910 [Silvibacterium sp.]|nr:hypothetical protein [Silvibacterium sp.]
MTITVSETSGTLLDYGINTEPAPLETTLSAADTAESVIQLVVSNGSDDPIWCKQITFTLPVGTAASDLCDAGAAAQIKFLSASSGWSLASPSAGVFVATPAGSSFEQVTATGLAITLYHIQVNQQVGTFSLCVQEQSSNDGTNYSTYTAMYKLSKFPAGFYVNNFAASSPMVSNGGSVTLTWNGSNNATYTILYGQTSVDVSNQRSWKTPGLHADTCFILRASAQQNGETVDTYLNLAVNVQNPELTATSLGIGNTDPKNKLHIGAGESTIANDRVSVVIATKGIDTGIAIAQEGGAQGPVNLLVQASGAGAYIGTTSNHPLVLRTADADRASIDKNGDVWMAGTLTAKKFTGEGALVKGMIVMWSGKANEIPAGWALCDGTNGTPDLRDRFILGTADSFESPTDKKRFGGQSAHTHTMQNAGEHSHGMNYNGSWSLNLSMGSTAMDNAGIHTHAIDATSVLPPYYKVAFIIKGE